MLRRLTFMALALAFVPLAEAGVLATRLLPMPLAPEMPSSTQIDLTDAFDATQPIWVSYTLIAISPIEDPEGRVVVTGMFEREPTSPAAGTVLFEPRDLRVTTSAGTIQQQFEQNFGRRSESELRAIWGDAMYEAYLAVNAGTGRLLEGTVIRQLPPLRQGDPIVLVRVEGAQGLQPAGLLITIGQGEIPAAHQPNVESTASFQFGLGLGKMLPILLLIGVAYVVVRLRR